MPAVETSIYRCAVYTRKSHEDGLDQDFNSLDAQSEACKAYIASQAGLGWNLRDTAYDDGGISGGHMERPALQALISDIKAGLIDVIVVYKVDRLTRSLTDFAKLVDVFDEHDVSFVSVTQAFNTTTSMGRLTLNVLLSFAQFEREVTAERIRDKIAASKAKGMWMGGNLPLGYRNEDRKLHIEEREAQTVRSLFELYLKHKNVRLVKTEADRLGLVSKGRTYKDGKRDGVSFSRGNIFYILHNPVYIGQIQHKGKLYDGIHTAIIDKTVWDDVHKIFKTNAVQRKMVGNSKSPTLLAGLLFDGDGHKLVPHHANKKGTRYHYYVSQRLRTGDQDTGWRIPAKTIERVVNDSLISTLSSKSDVLELLRPENMTAETMQSVTHAAKRLAQEIKTASHQDRKALFNSLIDTITLQTHQLTVIFKKQGLEDLLDITLEETAIPTLTKPVTIRRRGQEMKIVIDGQAQKPPQPDAALIKLISTAYQLRISLETGEVASIKDFAALRNMDHGDAKNLIPLAYLAPDIVEDILAGHQPVDLTARRLKYISNLPHAWPDQRTFLGFT